ncbi:MAG: sodium:solute symporter family protein [Bacteroidales bacterium]
MGHIDIWVIIVFSTLVFICGMSFARSGSNMKSFFAAGGALPWWMSGLSLFMSFFSAGTFVVWGSIAYTSGWVAISIQWTMAIAGLIIGFFIAPRWRKTGALTAAQFITERLGYKTQKVYTYLFLFISIFTTAFFLYPVAKIVEVSSGIPINLSILVLGLLILVYTAVGGLWAVIVTDVLQFVVLTAAVLILVPLSFNAIGGVDEFVTGAPEGFFSLVSGEYSWEFVIAFGFYNLFFIAGNWAYVQRYTSVSTPKDAKKVGWLFGMLYMISPVIWMIPPMIYRVLNPELTGLADEGAYLLMAKQVLPAGMLGLMLGGMIFAASSSVNTTLNISAGVISNDIYKHFKPNASNRKLVRVGRLATISLGLITIFIALMVPAMGGIVEAVISLGAITGGALFLPPIWALFSKRQNGRTVLLTTIITLIINAFFKFITPLLFNISLSRSAEMMLGVGLPVLLLTIFELWLAFHPSRNQYYEDFTVSRSQETQKTEEEAEEDKKGNLHGLKVLGFGIFSTGILIGILSIISPTGGGMVISMGLIVFVIGAIIIIRGIINKRKI